MQPSTMVCTLHRTADFRRRCLRVVQFRARRGSRMRRLIRRPRACRKSRWRHHATTAVGSCVRAVRGQRARALNPQHRNQGRADRVARHRPAKAQAILDYRNAHGVQDLSRS
jgi:hypothetical protein